MKKVLFFAMIAMVVFACKKEDPKDLFHEQLMGSWEMECARLDPADPWLCGFNTEPSVCVSEDYITEPWTRNYTVLDENTFEWMVGSQMQTVDVEFWADSMMWTFHDNSQMKFSAN